MAEDKLKEIQSIEENQCQQFWLDGFEGEAQGGYFIRNDLFKFFEKLKESNLKPVGIIFNRTWNLEIIVEK